MNSNSQAKGDSPFLKKSLLVLSIFALTTFVAYGATTSSGGLLKSTPYQSRNAAADATLSRLTNGAGAGILDGVIASVRTKAESKGGTPMNIMSYNAYLDNYLNLVDKLDNTTRTQYGSDYAFLFQYIYPRVLELRKEDSQMSAIVQGFKDFVGGSTGATVDTNTTTTTCGERPSAGNPQSSEDYENYMSKNYLEINCTDYHYSSTVLKGLEGTIQVSGDPAKLMCNSSTNYKWVFPNMNGLISNGVHSCKVSDKCPAVPSSPKAGRKYTKTYYGDYSDQISQTCSEAGKGNGSGVYMQGSYPKCDASTNYKWTKLEYIEVGNTCNSPMASNIIQAPIIQTPVVPASVITRLYGVPCGANGCSITRGTKIHGEYVFSGNASNIQCKVWYSKNAAGSLGDEVMFSEGTGWIGNTSSKVSNSFDIDTASINTDATSFVIQSGCSGLVNGVHTTVQDKQVVTLLAGTTSNTSISTAAEAYNGCLAKKINDFDVPNGSIGSAKNMDRTGDINGGEMTVSQEFKCNSATEGWIKRGSPIVSVICYSGYTKSADKCIEAVATNSTATATNPVAASIDYVAEITAMFAGNPYTKLYHTVPTQEHIADWTREINQKGLAMAKAFFPIAIKNYACSADPDRYYLANNPDVKAYYDAHPSENVDNSGAKKHWDSSGKNEQRISCW